jgi:hypothetical protein
VGEEMKDYDREWADKILALPTGLKAERACTYREPANQDIKIMDGHDRKCRLGSISVSDTLTKTCPACEGTCFQERDITLGELPRLVKMIQETRKIELQVGEECIIYLNDGWYVKPLFEK